LGEARDEMGNPREGGGGFVNGLCGQVRVGSENSNNVAFGTSRDWTRRAAALKKVVNVGRGVVGELEGPPLVVICESHKPGNVGKVRLGGWGS